MLSPSIAYAIYIRDWAKCRFKGHDFTILTDIQGKIVIPNHVPAHGRTRRVLGIIACKRCGLCNDAESLRYSIDGGTIYVYYRTKPSSLVFQECAIINPSKQKT